MADDAVTVQVTGEAGGATDALKDVAQNLKDLKEQVSSVTEGVSSFKDEFLKAFTVEKVLEFVVAMTESATAVERLTTALGVSAATVDMFATAGRAVGTTVSGISEGMTKLENTVTRANTGVQRSVDALADLGLKARDFVGLDTVGKINLIAEKVAVLKDGTEKTAAVTAVLGSAASALLPILNEGAGAFEKYAEMSRRAGSAATGEFLAEMSRLDDVINESGKALAGLGQTIVTAFAPALSGLGMVFVSLVEGLNNSIREGGAFAVILNVLVVAAQGLATALVIAVEAVKTLWEVAKAQVFAIAESFMTLGAIIKDVFTFNFAQAKTDFDALGTSLRARAQVTADSMTTIMKEMTAQLKTIWTTAAVDRDKSEQTQDVNRKRRNQDEVNAAIRAADAEVQAAREVLRQRTALLDLDVATSRITQNQKFALLEQYTQQAYESELKSLQSELLIGGLKVSQQQEIFNKIRQLKAQHETEMINLDKQSIQAQIANWRQYTDAVAGAFNSQMRGILTGQTSFVQASKNILLDLSLKTIELLVTKPVSEYIAGQLALLTANQSGAAARAATEVASAEAALPAKIASFTSDLTARAALTFAGIMANLSPLIGPAAAGPAAVGEASVMAQMAAVPKFDVGAWSVPKTGLAVIHKDEMILPAGAPADAVRSNMSGGGGGGGDTHNWHITAWDAGSVQSWLKAGGAAMIAKPLAAYQDKNPSSRQKRG